MRKCKVEVPPFIMIKSRINATYGALFGQKFNEAQQIMAGLEQLFKRLPQKMLSLPIANVLQGHCFILSLSGPILAQQVIPDLAQQLAMFLKNPNPWQMSSYCILL